MPIRKGDGTALSPKGISEGRKGDGTVLYSAIPDSVVNNLDYWWPVDDGSGATLRQVLGNETQEITTSGATWGSTPEFNPYLDFDGTDDTASVDAIDANGQTLSVCLWGFFDTVGAFNNTLISATDSTANGDAGWSIGDSSSDGITLTGFSNGSNSGPRVTGWLTDGEWGFAAVTLDGDNLSIRCYDTSSFIGQDSGTVGRATTTASATSLILGEWAGGSILHEGGVVKVGLNTTTALSDSAFDNIWSDTRP
jgi:hypothetical protein